MSELFGTHELDSLEGHITHWLLTMKDRNETIVAVDRGDIGERRWYVRMRGEEKEFTTVWLTLGQRTLRYETYVMPAPEENAEQLYEHVLRRNESLVGAHFSIGIEDAIFLRGELPLRCVRPTGLRRYRRANSGAIPRWRQSCCGSSDSGSDGRAGRIDRAGCQDP